MTDAQAQWIDEMVEAVGILRDMPAEQWIDDLAEAVDVLRDMPAAVRAKLPNHMSVEAPSNLGAWLRASIVERLGCMNAPALAQVLKRAVEQSPRQ